MLLFLMGAVATSASWAQGLAPARPAPRVISIDRVVAVVNDEAITQHDVDDASRIVLQQMKQQKLQPPPVDVLEKQVLERLITERSLLQFAKETGVKVDDTLVERAIQRIAQDNKLSTEDFRKALAQENISYTKYREDIRNELIVQRLREREVESRLTVSDSEVEHYLATLKVQNAGDSEYELAHILVIVPEQASRTSFNSCSRVRARIRSTPSGVALRKRSRRSVAAPISGKWRQGFQMPVMRFAVAISAGARGLDYRPYSPSRCGR